jgi:hypothetical protein
MRIYKEEEPEQSYVPKLKEMAEFIDSVGDPSIKGALVMGCKCMLRLSEMLFQERAKVNFRRHSAIV